jgi:hypothetical protein
MAPLSNQNSINCLNCKSHAIYDNNNKLLIPCTNCAAENDWYWNGQRCYGCQDREELNDRDITVNAYLLFYKSRGLPIDTCLNNIPEECHELFLELVNCN